MRAEGERVALSPYWLRVCSHGLRFDVHCKKCEIAGYCGCPSCGDEQAVMYHRLIQEREALALQLAHEWGWPDSESVLTRLRGDRTAALTTFTNEVYAAFLGLSSAPQPPLARDPEWPLVEEC